MAFIKYISYNEASDELKALYEKYGGKDKIPANIVRIAGLNPKALAAHIDIYKAIMFGKSPLSRDQREMIAVVVSAINGCHYWIEHHWSALRALGNVEDSLKKLLVTDFKSADISEIDQAILNYAAKLTKEPACITKRDVSDFRAKHTELTDHMLHDIVQVVSYFNYVNRLADGLGVELEERHNK